MAHKKGLGSSRNGRDSNAQRLGVKAFGGQLVSGGSIIVRQRGTRIKPGLNVGRGKDDTLFAKITGRIKFVDKGGMGKFVLIEPEELATDAIAELQFAVEELTSIIDLLENSNGGPTVPVKGDRELKVGD